MNDSVGLWPRAEEGNRRECEMAGEGIGRGRIWGTRVKEWEVKSAVAVEKRGKGFVTKDE